MIVVFLFLLIFPIPVLASVTLPFSTTYNCTPNNQTDVGWPNCDGMSSHGSWTATNGGLEQITNAANNPNGGGGNGQRHWISDGKNGNSGSITVSFAGVPEIYISYCVRFQSGLQFFTNSGTHKMIYFTNNVYLGLGPTETRITVAGTDFTNGASWGYNDPMGWIAAVNPSVNRAIRSWQEESSRLSSKHPFPQGSTQDLGWISPLLQSYDPSINDWHQDTSSTKKTNRLFPLNETGIPWYTAVDPSIQSWTIDSTFNSKHKPFPIDNIDVDWISATFAQAFDPATLSWTIPSTDRTVINQSLFHDSEKRPVQGGISEEIAATPFDPSTMEWGIDTLLPASKKDHQVWFGSIKPNENFGLTDARPIIPAIQQLIDSVQRPWDRRKKKSATDEPLDGWLTTSLPAVWDPQFTPHSTDLRLTERYKRVPHVDTLFEGWLSPVLPYDARFFPQSLDTRPYARYRRPPQLDQAQPAWQYTTTAAIVSGTGALHMGDSTMTGSGTAAGSPVVSTRLNTIDLDYNIMLIKGNT